ncbi:MAG: dTDP-4-dehydrorhamnose 3,5-epimerase [Alteromonas naphthalenivorans]|jgi:dTDP-4-dehydrorhamnose 3,5-epimerase
MFFKKTSIQGAYTIILDPKEDSRGLFARTFCSKEFEKTKITSNFVQCNISENKNKGTIRGLHLQKDPYAEDKLVRCFRGVIFDVCVDLRPNSSSYLQWYGEELSEDNNKALYIPKGCAHGYQTLSDNTLIFYQTSQFYTPTAEQGIIWNDSTLNIQWPLQNNLIISNKDTKSLPFSSLNLKSFYSSKHE